MALAAASAAFMSGIAAYTYCENNQTQRRLSKSGVKDPMTSYARYVLQREIEEAGEESNQNHMQTLQATSASLPPGDAASPKAVTTDPPIDMTPEEVRLEEATRKAKQHAGGLKVFSGNGNMALSLEIARHLGISLGKATVGRFADGEVNVVIHENVRGKDVYVVQPTGPPVNDNIMELLLMVSTLRRASARRITVVIPYYGYARQDRKMQVGTYTESTQHGKISHRSVTTGTRTHFSR